MPITAQYDRDADALYIRLADGERVRAITIDNETYVDVDASGRPIGIELLYPSLGLELTAVLERLALTSNLSEILTAVAGSGAPVGSLTMTVPGGQYTTSTSMVIVAPTAAGTMVAPGSTTSGRSEQLITAGC